MSALPTVSIIVPARDEAGTIRTLIERLPDFQSAIELIFVEGFSTDSTWDEIQRVTAYKRPRLSIVALQEHSRRGKMAAVEKGFAHASHDILMILDADLSVPPEDLLRFFAQAKDHPDCFITGSRFILSQEPLAMRYLNNVGNLFFARLFSLLLRRKITDTLCGTKVIWRKQWQRLLPCTQSLRSLDPFGDFSLLLGAHALGLTINEIPIAYKARIYGTSKISRFTDGIRLLLVVVRFLFMRVAC